MEKKMNDGSWDFVAKTTNEYVFIPKESVEGLKIDKILDLPTAYLAPGQCGAPPGPLDYRNFDAFMFFRDNFLSLPNEKQFDTYVYSINTGYNNLKSTTETINTATGQLTNSTEYTYEIADYLLPTKSKNTTSTGDIIEKRNKYVLSPEYVNTAPYTAMVQKNIISPVLEQKIYKISGSTETLLQTNNTIFKQFYPSIIKPEKSETYYLSNITGKISINRDYDLNGNITMQQKGNDVKEVYLWGYGGQYPVAKVINADYATISGFVNQTLLDDPSSTDTQIAAELNKIRIGLSNTKALVTTFTYEPLVGATSQTDANGRTIYYEYDAFQRLKAIRDHDNNIIKTYSYQYGSQ